MKQKMRKAMALLLSAAMLTTSYPSTLGIGTYYAEEVETQEAEEAAAARKAAEEEAARKAAEEAARKAAEEAAAAQAAEAARKAAEEAAAAQAAAEAEAAQKAAEEAAAAQAAAEAEAAQKAAEEAAAAQAAAEAEAAQKAAEEAAAAQAAVEAQPEETAAQTESAQEETPAETQAATEEQAAAETEKKEKETEKETEKQVRLNTVTFRMQDGAQVSVAEDSGLKTITSASGNPTATAKDGKLVFSVTASEGWKIATILVDESWEARHNDETADPNDYVIEGIQTDSTVITVYTDLLETEGTEAEVLTEETTEVETEALTEEATEEEADETEETETEVAMPEAVFNGAAGGVRVHASVGEGTFPEGTTMEVTPVSKAAALDAAQAASGEDENVVDAIAVDISFYYNGAEIQPAEGHSVNVSLSVFASKTLDGDNFTVLHQDDNGAVSTVSENASATGASFAADSFSIYVISGEEAKTKTVTYKFLDAAGNVIDGATQTLVNGETLYLPASPEKEGYMFKGWNADKNATSGFTGQIDSVAIDDNTADVIEYYPIYEQAYYVYFMDNNKTADGTLDRRVSETRIVTDTTSVNTSEVKIPLSSTEAVTGWYYDDNTFAKPAPAVLDASIFTGDSKIITLYPKVESGNYLLFNTGEQGSYIEPAFVVANQGTVQPTDPTRPGFEFVGWSEKENATANDYEFGKTLTKTTTLYAVWKAKANTPYTVIYWKQSITDKKDATAKTYDYAGSDLRTGKTGATVKATAADQAKNYTGFHFATSDQQTIRGDGKTIVNVYYDRNLLTINFKEKNNWGQWTDKDVFTGLYGQTLAFNGYEWPADYVWNSKSDGTGTRLTFLDAFIFDNLEHAVNNKTQITEYNRGKTSGSYYLRHYKQNLFGTYSYNAPSNSTRTDGETWTSHPTWTFTNKYDGFTVDSYRKTDTNGQWTSITAGDKIQYEGNLYVRYRRNSYKLAFYNHNAEDTAHAATVLFEAPLKDKNYTPTRPSTLSSVYEFKGWYKDKELTQEFKFDSEIMPANNLMLYAKWEAPDQKVKAHTSLVTADDSIYTYQFEYGKAITEKDLPTVKNSDGTTIVSGNSDVVTLKEGYNWVGWAEKNADGTYKIWNFDNLIVRDVDLYPYALNTQSFTVTYQTQNGNPVDSEKYAENSSAEIKSGSGVQVPEGQVFLYWKNTDTADTNQYYAGDKILIQKDITLEPVFGDKAKDVKLTFKANNAEYTGTVPGTVTAPRNEGKVDLTVLADTTTKKFLGWSTSQGATTPEFTTGKVSFNSIVQGTEKDNNGHVHTLYGVWQTRKKLVITITGKEVTEGYDGKQHTAAGYTYKVKVGDDAESDELPAGITLSHKVGIPSVTEIDAGDYSYELKVADFTVGGVNIRDYMTPEINVTKNVILNITKKNVTLKSADLSKTYDGKALVNGDTKLATEDGWVEGEGATYTFTGSQLDEGSSANAYTYILKTGTKKDNYNINKVEGTLTVKPITAKKIVITAASDSKTYDGSALTKDSFTYTQDVLVDGDEIQAVVEGSQTDAGESANKVTSYKVVRGETDVTGNYTFGESVDGKLEVTKRDVTLTSASDEKVYDGVALTNDEVTAEGFVEGEGATYNVTGSQLDAGNSKNTFTYDLKANTKAGNYNITKVEGDLVVKTIKDEIVITADSDEKTYDGKALTKDTFTYTGKLVDGDKIQAVVEGSQTDVGESANKVTSYKVMRGQTNVTDNYTFGESVDGTLKVTKRDVTLTSASDEKVYDGTPLTNDEVTAEGFVEGEGATYNVTGSRLDAGFSNNTFTYELQENTKAGNYNITPVEGTLTVKPITAKKIVITAASDSKVYDGSALTKDSFTYTQDVLVDGDEIQAVVEGSQTDAGESANKVTSYKVVRGETDVTGNYTFGESVDGKLEVTKRNVTLKSADLTKVYDGKALVNGDTKLATEEGWVEGEGATYTFTGSQLDKGSSANAYTYTLKTGTKKDNYNINKEEGTLTVNPITAKKIVITADSDKKTYDGSALTKDSFTYTQDVLVDGDEIQAVVKGSQTDAGESANKVTSYKVMRGETDVTKNYTFGESVDGKLEVTKRDVTLTSASDEKVYDGTPLTNDEVTAEGFVEGEGATYNVTGSQLDAGFSNNTFTYELQENTKAGNYNITPVEGTLTVNPITEKTIVITAASDSKVYDGSALTKDSFTYTQDVLVDGDEIQAVVEGSQTDAGESANKVTSYKVMRGQTDVTKNYTFGESVDGKLEVTKKTVTLKSADLTKVYDGTALVNGNTALATEEGFVDGEGATYTFTGSQTLVGSSDNTFTYTLKEGTKADNYTIEISFGTLTVRYEKDGDRTPDDKIIKKTHEDGEFGLGDTITFIIKVTNIYAQPTTIRIHEQEGVVLEKDVFENVAPGATIEARATHVVTAADLAAEGNTYKNTVTATLDKPEGAPTDDPTPNPKAEDEVVVDDTPLEVSVVANGLNAVYNGMEQSVSGFVGQTEDGSIPFEKNGQNFTISGIQSSMAGVDAVADTVIPVTGNAVVTDVNGEDVTAAFAVKVTEGHFQITKAPLTITTPDVTYNYNGAVVPNEVRGNITAIGLQGKDTITANFTGEYREVGEYPNTFDYAFAAKPSVVPALTDTENSAGSASQKLAADVTTGEAKSIADNYNVTEVPGTVRIVRVAGTDNLDVVKKTHEGTAFKAGETIRFTITAKNIFDIEKTITITEQEGVTLEGTGIFEHVAPGATVTAYATYVVTEDDVKAGSFTNTATATISGDGMKPETYTGKDTVDQLIKEPEKKVAGAHKAAEKPAEKPAATNVPKTGDETPILPMGMAVALSLFAVAVLGKRKREESNS